MVDVLSLFRLNSVGGSVQNAHRTPNYYRVIVVEDRTGPVERRCDSNLRGANQSDDGGVYLTIG